MQILTLRKCLGNCSIGRRNSLGRHCSRVDKCPLLMTAIHCSRRPCHYLPKHFYIFFKFGFPGRALWLWAIKRGFVIVSIFFAHVRQGYFLSWRLFKWFRTALNIFGLKRAKHLHCGMIQRVRVFLRVKWRAVICLNVSLLCQPLC